LTRVRGTCSIGGCNGAHKARGYCKTHYNRVLQGRDVDAPVVRRRRTEPWSYVTQDGYLYGSVDGRWIGQHRHVMEQHLGRRLRRYEEVHHLNGDRSDNRLENLELWSTRQPKGQRVEDKVAWAKELLALYEPGALV